MKTYWSRLDGVFHAIGKGDDNLGIPPYNGGLFDPALAPLLKRIELPDAVVAEVVFRLSHADIGDGRPKYINYRDLSVQQLGSVYERILEHGLKIEDGRVVVAENPAARKTSGSYYTPEELVTSSLSVRSALSYRNAWKHSLPRQLLWRMIPARRISESQSSYRSIPQPACSI
jgi:hypothetical protein